MSFKEYEKKFRKRTTSSLIKGYSRFNDDFRRIARDEFKRRNVPSSKLPYTKRKGTQKKSSSMFDFRF